MNIGGSVRINPLGLACLCGFVLLILYFNLGGGGENSAVRTGSGRKISMKELLSVSIEVAKRGGLEVKKIREAVSEIFLVLKDDALSKVTFSRLISEKSRRARREKAPTTR